MKVVILAGGLPSTLLERNERKPKPMAEIAERPILWHIMKYYAAYGHKDFIVCGGYKVDEIKEYFMNFYYHQCDITVDLETNDVHIHRKQTEDWKVTVVDTGLNTNVSERILKIKDLLGGEEQFFITYGDCLSSIDLDQMLALHKVEKRAATLAVARPSGRNVILPITKEGFRKGAKVEDVLEDAWVNSCNMIFSQDAIKYIEEHNSMDHTLFHLGNDELLSTYFHNGFWSPIETVRDRDVAENMWKSNQAPWKIWE